jgi:hypothetical protein
MGDKHLARVLPGKSSAGHAYPRPSDKQPVFMFGRFDPDRARSVAARARHDASLGTEADGASMVSARRTRRRGYADAVSGGRSFFMFGVHPE